MELDLGTVWSAAGVVVAFQVAAYTLRISREIQVASEDDLTWLPPADLLNVLSMTVTMIGVFVMPVLGLVGSRFAERAFGLSVLLLVGYAGALAGHYEMFNPRSVRSMRYFPLQEKVAVAGVGAAVVAYLILAFIR